MKLHFLSAAILLATGASAVHAQTFTPAITQTVGTGSEESFFTVDFEDGTANQSYAFGYKYDGNKTGGDLLAALAAGTPLQVGYYPGYGPTNAFVQSFSFNGHTQTGAGNNYWAYWQGTDGQNWTFSDVGASGRGLTNGSWDGWSWDADYSKPPFPAPAPLTPAAVPEASSVVSLGLLLGFGVIALRRKKITS